MDRGARKKTHAVIENSLDFHLSLSTINFAVALFFVIFV